MSTKADRTDRSTPHIEVVQVTPQMAATWLGTMTGNRTLRKSAVNRYAREMLTGMWLLNGEAIKFTRSGRLVDGQHRLNAVIMSGRTVSMFVLRNLDEDGVITLDTGVGRNFADHSTIMGRPYGQITGVIAKWWYKYEKGSPTNGNLQPTHQELEELIQRWPHIESSASFIAKHKVLTRRCTASVQGFVHAYTSAHYDQELADLFMGDLDRGSDLKEGNPILTLRRRLVDNATVGQKVPAHYVLAWTTKAWNAWMAGEELRKLLWVPNDSEDKKGEDFPRFELRKAKNRERAREQSVQQRKRARLLDVA